MFIPPSFQLHVDTFDDTYRFLGPALGSRARSTEWQPPADGSPVLLISLGTHFNDRPEFFTLCVEAFADSPRHVAMAVGPAEVGPAPANFDVRPSFPQPAVLGHASVFVSHTGMGSTMESLYSGVPLVPVPQMAEQSLDGDRVQELGLGLRLDTGSVTAGILREAVEKVATDPDIRARVDQYGLLLRSFDAAAFGADALVEFLSSTGPSPVPSPHR